MNETDFYKRLLEEKGLELVDNPQNNSQKKRNVSEDKPSRDLTKENESVYTKKFDDIERFYKFGRFDFQGISIPLFLRFRGTKMNYAEFLKAGTDSRVCKTVNIFDILHKEMGGRIGLENEEFSMSEEHWRHSDLELVLSFSKVPFQNAPGTTLKDKDLFVKKDRWYPKTIIFKVPANFNLFRSTNSEIKSPIGKIEYILPHDRTCYGSYNREYNRFTCGGIKLKIFGSQIVDETQYSTLIKEL